jgi:hypothetical protein
MFLIKKRNIEYDFQNLKLVLWEQSTVEFNFNKNNQKARKMILSSDVMFL